MRHEGKPVFFPPHPLAWTLCPPYVPPPGLPDSAQGGGQSPGVSWRPRRPFAGTQNWTGVGLVLGAQHPKQMVFYPRGAALHKLRGSGRGCARSPGICCYSAQITQWRPIKDRGRGSNSRC